jgi:hypothetical protein
MVEESPTRLPLTAWLLAFVVLASVRIALRAIFPDAPWYVLTLVAVLAYSATLVIAWQLQKRQARGR